MPSLPNAADEGMWHAWDGTPAGLDGRTVAMMTRRSFLAAAASGAVLGAGLLAGCAGPVRVSGADGAAAGGPTREADIVPPAEPMRGEVTPGTETYRGFTLDNVLHSEAEGDIHFNLLVPESYDEVGKAALFVTLPGYQGLYFQGVGGNIQTEDFAFEAQAYDSGMIIAAPQLSDWGEASARQTIALVKHLIGSYAIDEKRVFLEGYSGGGETLSLVMGIEPGLFCAALFCSSQWDGDLSVLADARVPVYLVIGESDEYYGSEPAREAYAELAGIYRSRGLPEDEVARLATLDVKDAGYFQRGGVTNQHGGGGALFCRDPAVMGWLFGAEGA